MTKELSKRRKARYLDNIDNATARIVDAQMEGIRQVFEPTRQVAEMLSETFTAPVAQTARRIAADATSPVADTLRTLADRASAQVSLGERMSEIARQADMPTSVIEPLEAQEREAEQIREDLEEALRSEGDPDKVVQWDQQLGDLGGRQQETGFEVMRELLDETRLNRLESTEQWKVSTWITVGSLAVAVLALFGALPQGIAAIPDAWDVIRGNW